VELAHLVSDPLEGLAVVVLPVHAVGFQEQVDQFAF